VPIPTNRTGRQRFVLLQTLNVEARCGSSGLARLRLLHPNPRRNPATASPTDPRAHDVYAHGWPAARPTRQELSHTLGLIDWWLTEAHVLDLELESVLAFFFARPETALELGSGADLRSTLMCGTGPGDLGGPGVYLSLARLLSGTQDPPTTERGLAQFERYESIARTWSWLFYLYSSPCLNAVWLEIFGPVFPGCPADTDPRDPPISPGSAPHISLRIKSHPPTNSKAKWRRTKTHTHQTAFKYEVRYVCMGENAEARAPEVAARRSP